MQDATKVLLVEDEEIHANLFFYAMEDMGTQGIQTTWVKTAEEALDAAGQESFHLAIVDISLQNSSLDGISLTEKLRVLYPQLHIVVFTISRSSLDQQAAYQAGANFFLSKPLDFDELLGELNAIFSRLKA
jgi:CheY-like chemotaxis protein